MLRIAKIIRKRILPAALALVVFSAQYVNVYAAEDVTEDVPEVYEDGFMEDDADSSGIKAIIETAGFTELEGYGALTAAQMQSKENLAGHAQEVYECEEGVDYVENEVVVSAEDEEEAREYAQAYNADLVAFEYGNALLKLKPAEEAMERSGADMVSIAVAASSDMDIMLPAAWPNYIDEFFDGFDYSDFTDFEYEYDDPMLSRDDDRYQWHLETMEVNAAWRAGYTGNGVTVVVIDSGKSDHEELAFIGGERIVKTGEEESETYEITADTTETFKHGTYVSGLIGGHAGNDCGGAGVAPDCSLYMIKVDDNGDLNTFIESVAVSRAVDIHDADVINLSLGGPRYAEYFENSIKNAYDAGVAVVCASGNNGVGSSMYPASYPGAISVGATNRSDERASFSNYSSEVRYAAPGEGVFAPSGNGNSEYEQKDGTSFSTPIVTGMIAVMLSSGKINDEGHARVDQILKMLDKSCRTGSAGIGKGIPSLAGALGLETDISAPSVPIPDIDPGKYVEEEITVGLFTESSGALHSDLIFYSDDGKNVTFAQGQPSENAKRYDPVEKIVITGRKSTVIKAIAVNPSNGMVSAMATYKYELAPLVTEIDVTSDSGTFLVRPGKNLSFTAECLPEFAANKAVTYAITGFPEGLAPSERLTVNGNRVNAPVKAVPGVYEITATAKDGGGASYSFDVTVVGDDKKVTSISASKTVFTMYAGNSEDIEITLITTENGDKQVETADEFSIWTSSDDRIAEADLDGNTLTVTAKKAGKVTIKGIATDGSKTSRSIVVNVRSHPEEVVIEDIPCTGDLPVVAAGMCVQLYAKVVPEDAYNRNIIWSISGVPGGAEGRSSVVIDKKSGRFWAGVRAFPGVYTVKAEAADKDNDGNEVFAECYIEVTQDLVKKIELEKKSASVFRVENAYDSPTSGSVEVFLTGGEFGSIGLTNSAPGTVSAALVERDEKIFLDYEATGGATGTAKLTVKSMDGTQKSAAIAVTVNNPPSYMEISRPAGTCSHLVKGKTMKLTVKFGEAYGKISAGSKRVTWSSSAPENVSVSSNGTVSAKVDQGQSATITADTTDGSGVNSRVTIYGYGNTASITTDGMWKRWKRVSDGTYYGEYVDYIECGKNTYMSLEGIAGPGGGWISGLNGSYGEAVVNKEGLSVKWISVTREAGKPNSSIALYGNKPGTYYLTISLRDKSTASKRFRIVVK